MIAAVFPKLTVKSIWGASVYIASIARKGDHLNFGSCRVEGTQSPPLIETDGRISRIRLSEVVHRNGYRFHVTVVGIFQS